MSYYIYNENGNDAMFLLHVHDQSYVCSLIAHLRNSKAVWQPSLPSPAYAHPFLNFSRLQHDIYPLEELGIPNRLEITYDNSIIGKKREAYKQYFYILNVMNAFLETPVEFKGFITCDPEMIRQADKMQYIVFGRNYGRAVNQIYTMLINTLGFEKNDIIYEILKDGHLSEDYLYRAFLLGTE